MLKKLISFFLLNLLISFPAFATHKTTEQAQVNAFVNELIDYYVNHDAKDLANLYHPQAIVIGTGSTDVFQGRKNIERAMRKDFSESTEAKIHMKKINIAILGNNAFATYDVAVDVKAQGSNKPFKTKLRFTLGLVKQNNHWLVMQSHLSAPWIEQKAGGSLSQSGAV